ncbi:MAG: NAD(P)-dependent oxidoreductase [Opitutales bacterium]|nr:NAD(P)-dependent oxidoreductase [Opitutales bacterium]
MKEKKIAFVGLGRMGANMARCLHDKGYDIVALFDIQPAIAQSLAEELEATAIDTLAEISTLADVIFTVVTNDAAMESIFFGDDNLLQQGSGRVFINCATLSPGIHQRVETAAKAVSATTLEACMASSIPQARDGELFLMIGGEESVYSDNKPILEDLSKALHYIGATGKAAEVKALVNMVMNINTAALAEGLGLGKALGLDLEMLCDVFRQIGANSRVLETDAEDMILRDHDCYFSAEHAAKDSGIALDLAKAEGVSLPLAQATLEQYQKMVSLGLGDLDKSGVAKLTFPGRKPS